MHLVHVFLFCESILTAMFLVAASSAVLGVGSELDNLLQCLLVLFFWICIIFMVLQHFAS